MLSMISMTFRENRVHICACVRACVRACAHASSKMWFVRDACHLDTCHSDTHRLDSKLHCMGLQYLMIFNIKHSTESVVLYIDTSLPGTCPGDIVAWHRVRLSTSMRRRHVCRRDVPVDHSLQAHHPRRRPAVEPRVAALPAVQVGSGAGGGEGAGHRTDDALDT